VLPRENESDLEDLPAETKRELEFVLVDSIEEVLEVAFADAAETTPVSAPAAAAAAATTS
jgi:ATP-dependent Lon protease